MKTDRNISARTYQREDYVTNQQLPYFIFTQTIYIYGHYIVPTWLIDDLYIFKQFQQYIKHHVTTTAILPALAIKHRSQRPLN